MGELESPAHASMPRPPLMWCIEEQEREGLVRRKWRPVSS